VSLLSAGAADTVQARSLERLAQLGRGMVVLALDGAIADRLALPNAAGGARLRVDLPFTAPINAAFGIDGGWSSRDRAHTMRVAADPASRPADLRIPGHVHPIRVDRRPLLHEDSDGTAGALELASMSGRAPAVALTVIVDRAGAPVTLIDARRDPDLARLPVASTAALRGALRAQQVSDLAVSCALPTRSGVFAAAAHAPAGGGDAMVALVHGDPASRERPLLHARAGCLLGDVFGSLGCACRAELDDAIVHDGAGIVLYTKPDAMTAAATCQHDRAIDAPVAAGLLRRIGVSTVHLAGAAGPLANRSGPL
jgi:3,4-dihydroxy 2-butanone 4-phosphate synthase/GTP cyclohydrolase II